VPNIIKTTHCLAAMSIKDHLIKLTMWWQGTQKLRNDRPGGAAAPPAPRQFRHWPQVMWWCAVELFLWIERLEKKIASMEYLPWFHAGPFLSGFECRGKINFKLLDQGFPTWVHVPLRVHLPVRRGTFKVSKRR